VAQTSLCSSLQGIVNNTICIARLKRLFIAAKAASGSIADKADFSIHMSLRNAG